MRFLCLLFALYFAVLGCLPCPDEVPPAGTATACAAADSHGHDEPGPTDHCSPLCPCHCCPGAVLLPARPAALSAAATRVAAWHPSAYAPAGPAALPLRPLATPWQPPQGA